MPAPLLIQVAVTSFALDTATTRVTSQQLNVYVGDIVVACGESSDPTHTVSFSGGTYTTWKISRGSSTNSQAVVWTCTVSSNDLFTPTVSRTGGAVSAKFGAYYYVFRNSGGIGAKASSSGTGTAATSINTTGATYPSAIVVFATDANGGVDSENPATWLTNAGSFSDDIEEYSNPGWTCIHAGYHPSIAQGSYSVGHSFPNNQYYDIIAVEVWGNPDPPVADVAWLSV
jgi:hypothetical protein